MSDNENLFAYFRKNFPDDLSRPLLLIPEDQSISYADADNASSKIANCLQELGAKKGDRVTVMIEKSVENLFLYLGCLKAGLVYHPMNTGYQASEISFLLEDAAPTIIICSEIQKPTVESVFPAKRVKAILTLENDGTGTLAESYHDFSENTTITKCRADDTAALLYSSGTTGKPKGIILSHKNLSSNANTLSKSWGFTHQDRLLHALPIYHVHGLFIALGPVLLTGASMSWHSRFDVDSVIRSLAECTVMMGVPTYYTRMLDNNLLDPEVCKNMRVFICGSAPLLPETFKEFEFRTGHPILERYGMTETGINTSNPLKGKRIPGTVGQALPGTIARIVDDTGKIVHPGETGNLQVKGDNVFSGYWNMPEKTAEDFTSDGFFNTGDKAVIDKDRYISIVGRSKDMIISGGLNIYPREIELVIDQIPEVIESAVIGTADHDFGEKVVAVVVSRDNRLSTQKILDACRQKLASFKSPKMVHFLDELPRNAMGKVQKNLLRKQFSDN